MEKLCDFVKTLHIVVEALLVGARPRCWWMCVCTVANKSSATRLNEVVPSPLPRMAEPGLYRVDQVRTGTLGLEAIRRMFVRALHGALLNDGRKTTLLVGHVINLTLLGENGSLPPVFGQPLALHQLSINL